MHVEDGEKFNTDNVLDILQQNEEAIAKNESETIVENSLLKSINSLPNDKTRENFNSNDVSSNRGTNNKIYLLYVVLLQHRNVKLHILINLGF